MSTSLKYIYKIYTHVSLIFNEDITSIYYVKIQITKLLIILLVIRNLNNQILTFLEVLGVTCSSGSRMSIPESW